MARVKQEFLPVPVFVVQRPFRFNGRSYKPGEKFNWRKNSCSFRKIQLLFSKRLVALPEGQMQTVKDESIEEHESELRETELEKRAVEEAKKNEESEGEE